MIRCFFDYYAMPYCYVFVDYYAIIDILFATLRTAPYYAADAAAIIIRHYFYVSMLITLLMLHDITMLLIFAPRYVVFAERHDAFFNIFCCHADAIKDISILLMLRCC